MIRLCDLRVSTAARSEVAKVLKSGWLSTGPKCAELERALADYWQMPHVVGVSSASIGLIIALKAAGIRPGDEVITTPLTFVATLEAILQCGARPVLADIGEDLLIAPDQIARQITRRTGAVLTVDLAGHPCDYRAIRRTLNEHRALPVIADSSHAAATTYRGKSIGRCVAAAVFSLHATKNLTAGEGGAIACTRATLADHARLLTRHGMTANAWSRRASLSLLYDVILPGHKGNLSDLHAAVALGQLSSLHREQRRRAEIAMRYRANLQPFRESIVLPAVAPGSVHAWHLFVVRLPELRNEIARSHLMRLLRSRGIETAVHYRPLHTLRAYRERFAGISLPMVATIAPQLLSLPMHPYLSNDDIDRVCDELIRALQMRKGRKRFA